jgi:hypothetical protein
VDEKATPKAGPDLTSQDEDMPEEGSEGSQGWRKQPYANNDLGNILDDALATMDTKDGKEEKMELSTALLLLNLLLQVKTKLVQATD